jgi:hypothetical protein
MDTAAPSPCPLPQDWGRGQGEGVALGPYYFETINITNFLGN